MEGMCISCPVDVGRRDFLAGKASGGEGVGELFSFYRWNFKSINTLPTIAKN